MKAASTALYDTIRKNSDVEALPVLIVEWNLNRYNNVVADNTPSEDDNGYDIEVFPIKSIHSPNRPPAGIVKGRVDEARVSRNYEDGVPDRRWYLGGRDDIYKYWSSPVETLSTKLFPLHTDGVTMVRPRIEFFEDSLDYGDDEDTEIPDTVDGEEPAPAPLVAKSVHSNMIVIGLENSWSSPNNWDVQVKYTKTGAWTTIATNPVIDAQGRVKLYYNGSTWDSNERFIAGRDIWAIQLVVRGMDKEDAFFNLIELSPRLTLDVTDDLLGVNDTFDLGEPDHITPMGTLSANVANVTLFNDHGDWSPKNEAGAYHGLIDRNVEFRLYYEYALPVGTERIQQFKMFTDEWEEDHVAREVSVSLGDFAKFMQETKPKPVLYRNISVQEAVWRICDQIGFNDYVLEVPSDHPSSIIDIFWTTGQETVWEVFQELSRGTQCAIYFDSFGKLNIKTREAAFNNTKATVWTARQNAYGGELEDIISVASESAYEANKVVVNYTPTAFEEYDPVTQFVKMEIVYEPENTVVLRANDLQKDILADSDYIWVTPKDVRAWPYEGVVNIEGEFIKYSGRRYTYYDGDVKKSANVKSQEQEKKLLAKADIANRHLCRYDGSLVIKERGLWNSEKKDHTIDISDWTSQHIKRGGGNYTEKSPSANVKHNKNDSTVTVSNPKNFGWEDISMLRHGAVLDAGYSHLGTKLRFSKGKFRDDVGGIMFNMNGPGEGYYIEVTPTINIKGKERQTMNEIRMYSMKQNGQKKFFGGSKAKIRDKGRGDSKGAKFGPPRGATEAVVEGVWVELDIKFQNINGDHVINISVNGNPSFVATVPNNSGWQHNKTGRFALYARGHSSVQFDYAYAMDNLGEELIDEIPYFDRVEKAYYGQQWIRDWVYETKTVKRRVRKKQKKVQIKYNQRFFDEFGPVVHEVREMDVKFDVERPVLQSRLFSTNNTNAVCPEYQSNPWGAKFLIANTSRVNAVMHGDDNLTNPGNTIAQKMIIFGRPVVMQEQAKITRKNVWSIQRRGEIETEFTNKWIQSKSEAKALSNWLVDQWAKGEMSLSVEIFGNPLIELGDVIKVQHERLADADLADPTADDRFFVVGISSSFDQGISTSLTLRRA